MPNRELIQIRSKALYSCIKMENTSLGEMATGGGWPDRVVLLYATWPLDAAPRARVSSSNNI